MRAYREHASIADANAAVADDIASSALRYALAAAMSCVVSVWVRMLARREEDKGTILHRPRSRLTSSKHIIDARKSLREMSVSESERWTLEPVVVVENLLLAAKYMRVMEARGCDSHRVVAP